MIRNKVEILQKCRKRKYLTESNNKLDDDDSGQDDNVEVEPATIPAQFDDEVERPVVRFESGKTQKGGTCLWFEGYRYTKINGNYWRCTLRGCPANATIVNEDENGMSGTIGLKKHVHLPEPHKQEAEARRQKIKDRVKEEPRLKPTRLLAQVRRSAPDEAYVAMKSDNALRAMMRRQKKKILGNVDCTDPLAFVIPAVLREKRGEDILLYDSRNFRPNERDVVLIFGSEKNERGDAVRNSFRSVLSLPLLPPTVIRRAFTLIVDASPNGLEEFFLYFARTYIGLTQQQREQGAGAFDCNPRRSIDTATERLARLLFSYSTSDASSTTPSPVLRWKAPIARRPMFPVELWNMNKQAGAALARTNNGLEATHLHFMKGLSHHPALSDFVFEVNQSIDKQVDAARSARHFSHKRHKQYIIQYAEQKIIDI
ncbi:hypothetical protein GPALN_001791 [Globodera pallida]|nr:hypothetical protein GPALN_001791 [Globodera pallida]